MSKIWCVRQLSHANSFTRVIALIRKTDHSILSPFPAVFQIFLSIINVEDTNENFSGGNQVSFYFVITGLIGNETAAESKK